MKINDLGGKLTGARKRVGRGIGAGQGKTAGRGTKGQGARSGGGVRPGFEGGQNPLMHRIPKSRGFKSLAIQNQLLHSDQLNQFSGVVGVDELQAAGLIKDSRLPVKVVARGPVTSKVQLRGVEASRSTVALIEKAGGQVQVKAKQSSKAAA